MVGFWLCSMLLKRMSALRVICLGYAGIFVSALVPLRSCAGRPVGHGLAHGRVDHEALARRAK